MTQGDARVVELTLSRPDPAGGDVAGLVNLGNMTHAYPVEVGDAAATRIHFLDGSHVDVKETLAEVARLMGITMRRPRRLRWTDLAGRSNPARALRSGPTSPPGEDAGRPPRADEGSPPAADRSDESEE
ncbi:MAG: hypothetical protein M3O34_07245 [Chloroflexota bacterium]|nr:hypothetical protein [Chloroflexota bacterium]